jgi:hypothetical protein
LTVPMGEHSVNVSVAPTSIPGCFAIVLIVRTAPGLPPEPFRQLGLPGHRHR